MASMSERPPHPATSCCPWPTGTRQTLSSGLTVITERVSYPVTAVATTYKVGFRDEDEQTAGMAHLTEHMMGRAARRAARGSATGVHVEAESRRDYSTVGAVAPHGLLGPALQAGALRRADLTVHADDLATETALIEREYLDLIEARPYGLFPRFLAAQQLYDTVGEGGTGYGDPTALRAQTPQAVNSFVARHYTPARTVLCVVGDIHPDEVMDVVSEHFAGDTAETAPRQPQPVSRPLAHDREVLYRRMGVPDAVALAWPLPDPAGNLRAHIGLVLVGQATFTAHGPAGQWLRSTHPDVNARMWWGAFNDPWDGRTGLSLIVELTGANADQLTDVAMALRRALPDLADRVPSADFQAVAARSRLELTRGFSHPLDRARLLGVMEALFAGDHSWPDLWAALCDTRHDPAALRQVVNGMGCLVMRCSA